MESLPVAKTGGQPAKAEAAKTEAAMASSSSVDKIPTIPKKPEGLAKAKGRGRPATASATPTAGKDEKNDDCSGNNGSGSSNKTVATVSGHDDDKHNESTVAESATVQQPKKPKSKKRKLGQRQNQQPSGNKDKAMSTADINNAYLQAIKRCKINNESVKSTAVAFGVPRSSLQRYIKKCDEQVGDISKVDDIVLLEFVRKCSQRVPSNQIFSADQEGAMVEYSLKRAQNCGGFTINQLKELAYQLAKKLCLTYPPLWDEDLKADPHWCYRFMARHPQIVLRTPEQADSNPVKAFDKTSVDEFFKLLSDLMDDHHFPAGRIYNMAECGFLTLPKIGSVISAKGMRRAGQLEAADQGNMISMALTVDANGNSLPPFFVFPRTEMESSYMDNATSGSAGIANGSGRLTKPEFIQFVQHFITSARASLEFPMLLVLDNHASRCSVEALELAVANGVHVLSYPPQWSPKLQPLQISIFGTVKAAYESQCSAWQKNNNNKILEIRHVAGLVCKTLDMVLNPGKIKSGFKETGICPFDPDIFNELDFEQYVAENEEQALVYEDDQRRNVVLNPAVKHVEKLAIKQEPSTSATATMSSQ